RRVLTSYHASYPRSPQSRRAAACARSSRACTGPWSLRDPRPSPEPPSLRSDPLPVRPPLLLHRPPRLRNPLTGCNNALEAASVLFDVTCDGVHEVAAERLLEQFLESVRFLVNGLSAEKVVLADQRKQLTRRCVSLMLTRTPVDRQFPEVLGFLSYVAHDFLLGAP